MLDTSVSVVACMQAMCKQEHNDRPCPRTILVCCTALVTNGLYTEGLFSEEAPMELVHYLLGAFEEGESFPADVYGSLHDICFLPDVQ